MHIIGIQNMAKVFVGFSTVDKKGPPFQMNDIELIKTDIMNQFATKKGERVMLPDFGSIIHDYLMDPLDDYTQSIIVDDVKSVVLSDPRVQLNSDVNVTVLENGIRISVELIFLPSMTPDLLVATFTQDITTKDSF